MRVPFAAAKSATSLKNERFKDVDLIDQYTVGNSTTPRVGLQFEEVAFVVCKDDIILGTRKLFGL